MSPLSAENPSRKVPNWTIRGVVLTAVLALGLALAACGGSDSTSGTDSAAGDPSRVGL